MKINLRRNSKHLADPLVHESELNGTVADYRLEWHNFFATDGENVGWGYLGQQNKGAGWLIASTHRPNETFFAEIFLAALKKRQQLVNAPETTAFRLFNGIGDGLGGMTVDYYDSYLVISWYNTTINALKKDILAGVQKSYAEFFGVAPKGIVEKFRFQGAPSESEILEGDIPESFIVKENGINYRVYLNEGLMTGIFLDQREVRGVLATAFSSGKNVLNMFSYTGAFSVAAALGGASQTTSVDLAKRSLSKTQEQFEANGIDPETQKIYVMDVFGYFNYAKKKNLTYDIVVLDPPSFARNKKKTFSVAKNYGELVTDSQALIQNGQLICSTNAANVTMAQFEKMIFAALDEAGRRYRVERRFRLPADFTHPASLPEENYLKVLFIKLEA